MGKLKDLDSETKMQISITFCAFILILKCQNPNMCRQRVNVIVVFSLSYAIDTKSYSSVITAHTMSPSKNRDAEFAYGSGHLNPSGAINPGLAYDSTKDDHIKFLCKLGYDEGRIRLITGDSRTSCSKKRDEEMLARDVNYASMSALVEAGKPFTVKFQRTVTNVGTANSRYCAKIIEPRSKIKVTVEPSFLSFTSLKEQKSFNVTVVGTGLFSGVPVSASLSWSDGIHTVRSPIVMYDY